MKRTNGGALIAVAVLMAVAFAIAGAAQAVAATGAARGTLDPTFGHGGRVVAEPPAEPAHSHFERMAREPDGDLVLRLNRTSRVGAWTQGIEMRSPDGALVPSFGEGGKLGVQSNLGGLLATLPDGDILVGVSSCAGQKSSIAMIDQTGARVPSFGDDGCGPQLAAEPEFMTTDAQGRFLLAGTGASCHPQCYHDVGPVAEVTVERLLPDGTLDSSFGKGGTVGVYKDDEIAPKPDFGTRPRGLVSLAGGSIQIAASGGLIRLEEDGAAAKGLAETGVVAPLPIGEAGVYLRPDGGVVTAVPGEDHKSLEVRRFGPNGELDSAFGTAGITRVPIPEEQVIKQVVEAPGGDLTIAIEPWSLHRCEPCGEGLTLIRLTPSGALDPSFGSAGILQLSPTAPRVLDPDPPTAEALLVGADGSAVVAGADPNGQASISAIDATGAAAAGFGANGTVTEEFEQPVLLEPTGMALDPDGRLIVMNRRSNLPGIVPGFLLGFGAGGGSSSIGTGDKSVETPFQGQLIADGGGRFVVWDGEDKHLTLRAVDGRGRALSAYGTSGVATMPKGFRPKQVVPVRGGGVAVVGSFDAEDMAVYRLDPKGRAVAGFGRQGLRVISFPNGRSGAYAGLSEADGDLVITGREGGHAGAARLLPDGRLDPSFGRHGLVAGLLESSGYGPFGAGIASLDGGIVIDAKEVGTTRLIRLDHQGRLVKGFGRGGLVYGGAENAPLAIFATPRRIVVVTDTSYERGRRHSAPGGVLLWAFQADGSVDKSFGKHGRILVGGRKKGAGFRPAAAVQQADGKVVVAGTWRMGHIAGLELLRFR